MKKVAAIQMAARIGDVGYNLDHIRELTVEAIQQGAEIIALPEFFTTSIILDERVYSAVLPPENAALDLLLELAADHRVLIGGSYLEKRGRDVYNSYKLVGPEGLIGYHDKDQPTMIENAFYVGGTTDGVHKTDFGRVGTAVCWETIRSRTVARLANNVDFLMTGSHWWTSAKNWTLTGELGQQVDTESRALLRAAPGELARSLNVANIHASHCGSLTGGFAALPYRSTVIPMETSLIGEAQIVDNNGQIIARRTEAEGPGVLTAELELKPGGGKVTVPDSFWLPQLSATAKFFWWHQNWVGRHLYNEASKNGKF